MKKQITTKMIEDKKINERKRIGEAIVTMRTIKRMTQEELGNKSGILRTHISRIEQGRYSVGLDTLSKIAEALDCKIDLIDK